jgi:hypothetical protein
VVDIFCQIFSHTGEKALRKFSILLFLLAFVLVACQASTPTQAEPTEAPVATTLPQPSDTPELEKSPTPTEAMVSEGESSPGCTVESPFPTPGATLQSIFPAISESDWVIGPSDAHVTLLEYGDFQ